MTDRTDVDSPDQGEPSRPASGDEVVWPVWGAGERRAALHDETRQIPVVTEAAPAADEPTEPSADQAPEGPVAADEPAADETATTEPSADEPAAEPATDDGPVAGEPLAEEPVADEPARDEPVVEPNADEAAEDAPSGAPEDVEPAADELPSEEPAVAEPGADEAVDAAPSDEPEHVESAADEVPSEEPVVVEPSADEVASDAASVDEASAHETASDEVTDEPASAEPEPVAVESADGPASAETADEPGAVDVAAESASVEVAGEPASEVAGETVGGASSSATEDAAPDAPEQVAPQSDEQGAEPSVAEPVTPTGSTAPEAAVPVAGTDESTAEPSAQAPAADATPVVESAAAAEESAPADEVGSEAAAATTDEPVVTTPRAAETVVMAPATDETVVMAPTRDETVVTTPEPPTAPAGAAPTGAPAPITPTPAAPAPTVEQPVAQQPTVQQPTVLHPAGGVAPGAVPERSSVLPGRADRTSVLPAAAAASPAPAPTPAPAAPAQPLPPAGPARVTAGTVPQTPREPSPFDAFEPEERERRWPRRLLIGAGVLVVLGGAYVGASYATADRVPRGASVAGVDIGGLSSDEAVARLDDELSSSTGTTVAVQANDVQATIEPQTAGLSFDAEATVDGLTGVDLADPLRLWHQIAGLGESDPVTQVDEAKLTGALEALGTSLSLAPVDGAVLFVDGGAVLTDAAEGWALDEDAAADVVARDWLVAAQPIVLPTQVVEPAITQAAAQAALDEVAEPLVSAPISVTVADKLAVLQPATLAAAASMQPEDGELVLQLDGEALAEEVVAQLPEGVLTSASDAHFEFQDDKPVLVPGEPGTTVAADDVASAVAAVANAQDRTAAVELSQTDPSETTEAMEKLGIKEIVSEFSTPLTSEPRRTKNIAQGLANISGVLVRPGETFSLTDSLGPIDGAHGFVQAGAIVNGEHSDAWGGGLSQVSTTTFNAAYLAGMEDVDHTPHSEWFSRYPEGREATIFTGSIDMKWRNTTPYGALVQGWVSGGRAYVRIWGTKYYTVESTTSGRSGVVQPSTVYSDSKTCSPQSAGNPGFSVTVTRKLFLDGKLEETTSSSWRYKPQNRVVCGEPPKKDDEKKD